MASVLLIQYGVIIILVVLICIALLYCNSHAALERFSDKHVELCTYKGTNKIINRMILHNRMKKFNPVNDYNNVFKGNDNLCYLSIDRKNAFDPYFIHKNNRCNTKNELLRKQIAGLPRITNVRNKNERFSSKKCVFDSRYLYKNNPQYKHTKKNRNNDVVTPKEAHNDVNDINPTDNDGGTLEDLYGIEDIDNDNDDDQQVEDGQQNDDDNQKELVDRQVPKRTTQ